MSGVEGHYPDDDEEMGECPECGEEGLIGDECSCGNEYV